MKVIATKLCLTLCNPIVCNPPLSIEFSRQEYWSGLPCSSPWELPDPGIESGTPALQANSLPSEPPGKELDFPQDYSNLSLKKVTHFTDEKSDA